MEGLLSILPECNPHPITHLDKLTITTPPPEPATITNTPTESPLLSPETSILLYLIDRLEAKSFTSRC